MLAIGVMLGSALGRALADLLASVPSVILVSGTPSPTGGATLSRLAPRTRCIRLIDYPGASGHRRALATGSCEGAPRKIRVVGSRLRATSGWAAGRPAKSRCREKVVPARPTVTGPSAPFATLTARCRAPCPNKRAGRTSGRSQYWPRNVWLRDTPKGNDEYRLQTRTRTHGSAAN